MNLAQQVVQAVQASPDWLGLLWSFLNSPLGLTLVVGLAAKVVHWDVTRHPEHLAFFESNKGLLQDAVKFAEAAVPDGAPGSGAAKMKHALDYVNKVAAEAGRTQALPSATNVVKALELAHAAYSAQGEPLAQAPAPTPPAPVSGAPAGPGAPKAGA